MELRIRQAVTAKPRRFQIHAVSSPLTCRWSGCVNGAIGRSPHTLQTGRWQASHLNLLRPCKLCTCGAKADKGKCCLHFLQKYNAAAFRIGSQAKHLANVKESVCRHSFILAVSKFLIGNTSRQIKHASVTDASLQSSGSVFLHVVQIARFPKFLCFFRFVIMSESKRSSGKSLPQPLHLTFSRMPVLHLRSCVRLS